MPEFSYIEMLNFKLFIDTKDESSYLSYSVINVQDLHPATDNLL